VGEPLIGHEFSFYKELFKVCSLNTAKVNYNEPQSARRLEEPDSSQLYKKGELIEPEPSVIRILYNGKLKLVEQDCFSTSGGSCDSSPNRLTIQ